MPSLTLDQAESFLQYFLEQHNLRITPVHLFILSDSFKKCHPISLVYLKAIATLSTINSIQLSSDSAVNINGIINDTSLFYIYSNNYLLLPYSCYGLVPPIYRGYTR